MLAVHARKHGVCFSWGKDKGQLRRARNALDVVDEVQFSVEYLLIKKQQRTESLILSRCGDALLDSEMSEKVGDFFLAHVVRVAFAMKENVTANPIDIRLLGADRIMFYPQMPPNSVEQLWRGSDCGCGGRHDEHRVKIVAPWQAAHFGEKAADQQVPTPTVARDLRRVSVDADYPKRPVI
jgi:hypothetical protein